MSEYLDLFSTEILSPLEIDGSIQEIIIEFNTNICYPNSTQNKGTIICQYMNALCNKNGSYRIGGANYCHKHYSLIKDEQCNIVKKCKNKAEYRYPGSNGKKIQACKKHVLNDMFPIESLKCKAVILKGKLCDKHSSAYLLSDPEKTPLYCLRHAKLILGQYGEYRYYILNEYRSKHKIPHKV